MTRQHGLGLRASFIHATPPVLSPNDDSGHQGFDQA